VTDPNPSGAEALVHLDRAQLERFVMEVDVRGTIAQSVDLKLRRGQPLWCAKGSLLAYGDDVGWQLKIPGGAGSAMSRMMSGEGLSLCYVTPLRDGAQVTLTANQPGHLATWDLSRGPITCTAGAFVAAVGDVKIDVTVARKAGAALFGGGGLFMQRLSGSGVVIVHVSGDFLSRELKAGQKLLVSTGHLAVMSAEVDYGVRGVGGCLKSLVGGEGLFMTELTGPGWVMLQSLKKTPATPQRRAGR
jgi:uncharacterized protein (AIM24 family)